MRITPPIAMVQAKKATSRAVVIHGTSLASPQIRHHYGFLRSRNPGSTNPWPCTKPGTFPKRLPILADQSNDRRPHGQALVTGTPRLRRCVRSSKGKCGSRSESRARCHAPGAGRNDFASNRYCTVWIAGIRTMPLSVASAPRRMSMRSMATRGRGLTHS